MKKLLQIKLSANSLFVKLLTSFLAITFLLISFNFITSSILKNNIHKEIIKYNTSNLNNTVNSYEDHFMLVRDHILSLLSHDIIHSFNMEIKKNNPIDYFTVSKITDQIEKELVNTSYLYLDNIIFYYGQPGFIMEKGGASTPYKMFDLFYANEHYTSSFWKQQFDHTRSFQIFPSAHFHSIFTDFTITPDPLIPVKIQNQFYPEMYSIAFINGAEMFEALHNSINNNFVIFDEANEQIFPPKEINLNHISIGAPAGYQQEDDMYYFFKKGDTTGLTYINIIPNQNISSQLLGLNIILITLLIISILISIITSVFFSIRFNNPIKRIIESIHHLQSPLPIKTNINEYKFISEKIRKMIISNDDIHKNLNQRNSLLRKYAFRSKLKKIHDNIHTNEMNFSNQPFAFVLFKLSFKPAYNEQLNIKQDRANYFICEFIEVYIQEEYPESVTFQIEENQILTLILGNDHKDQIMNSIYALKSIFESDREYCFLTIAISPIHYQSKELTKAYEQVLNMTNQRALTDETQIITEEHNDLPNLIITPTQEKEFNNHLLEGNHTAILQVVERLLIQLQKQKAYAPRYAELAVGIINKVKQTLLSLYLDISPLEAHQKQLSYCYTIDTYKQFFQNYLTAAASIVKQRKEEQDHITVFVTDYLETHYSKDISLELVASKLKITPSYLSTYFKEKTGMNFSDYLNEIRINKAKQFLSNSEYKIQEISERVGYINVNSFSRMFKKSTGITPGSFRKKSYSSE